MAHFPELFIPEADEASRDAGTVYIADLMASHVLTSLKQNCAPQDLGFLHAKPVSAEEINGLHGEMTNALELTPEELQMSQWLVEMSVRAKYDEPETIEFGFDYWEGRPMKTTISTGPDTDKTTLTGFQPFSPWGFDRDQGEGKAQETIDALRETGDAMSMDVQALEGGRTFDRAAEAHDMSIDFMLQALEGKENPDLGSMLSEALEKYDRLREDER